MGLSLQRSRFRDNVDDAGSPLRPKFVVPEKQQVKERGTEAEENTKSLRGNPDVPPLPASLRRMFTIIGS